MFQSVFYWFITIDAPHVPVPFLLIEIDKDEDKSSLATPFSIEIDLILIPELRPVHRKSFSSSVGPFKKFFL